MLTGVTEETVALPVPDSVSVTELVPNPVTGSLNVTVKVADEVAASDCPVARPTVTAGAEVLAREGWPPAIRSP